MIAFNYNEAFSRNKGWVTEIEQSLLKGKRIAIAGLGGVGGGHLLTLARLGVGSFNIADFDTFNIVNLNRQAGAYVSQIGQPKIDVLANMALDINPELNLNLFQSGINTNNLDDFLRGVDLYIDGLDFFAIKERREVFKACNRLGIPAITVAPLGMGAATLVFLPGGMSFEDYFCFNECDENEMQLRFLIGLSPTMLQRKYLVDPNAVNFLEKKVPSSAAACQICSGFAATEALKILLGRGNIVSAPRGYHFDAYRNEFVKTWRPGGNRNILQKIGIWAIKRVLNIIKNSRTKNLVPGESE